MEKSIKPSVYVKQHSFDSFRSHRAEAIAYQKARAIRVLEEWRRGEFAFNHSIKNEANFKEILARVLSDLTEPEAEPAFKITQFIAEEMYAYDDAELPRFFYHRYRYDLFPVTRQLDNYPPYLQIEPTSLCNYRCVFCYQTDQDFFTRKSPAMGTMNFDTYREIVDLAHGHIEFLSLASRGEPTMVRELDRMLGYSAGKFLNLKLNTNASLLTEKLIHAILDGGVRTVVFSADAAAEPLYGQLRVNGKLERVLKNIELFRDIREKHYSSARIITRVSGVKVTDDQSIDSMESFWGGLVDQVTFVNYNPWENIYSAEPNNIAAPCSDLWRRMFVWHDGTINPCDSDYRSTLRAGDFRGGLSEIWLSDHYRQLRAAHENGSRQVVEPCRRCAVT